MAKAVNSGPERESLIDNLVREVLRETQREKTSKALGYHHHMLSCQGQKRKKQRISNSSSKNKVKDIRRIFTRIKQESGGNSILQSRGP